MARSSFRVGRWLQRFAHHSTVWTGTSGAFLIAAGVIVVWASTGPIFHFSDTWQLVINTGTTVVTVLMVFLIQRGQNKDAQAIQLKLNELIAAVEGASNRLLNVEDLSEEQILRLHHRYQQLARLHKHQSREACSVEEVLAGRAGHAAAGAKHNGPPAGSP